MRTRTLIGLAIIGLSLGVALGAPTAASTTVKSDPTVSAVEIATFKADKEDGHGSGVVLPSGLILTAGHVVADDDSFEVRYDGGEPRPAVVLWQDTVHDVAILASMLQRPNNPAPLECGAAVPVGEPIEVVGLPLDLGFVHTWGRIASGIKLYADKAWAVSQIADVAIAPGNSGGPVYSTRTGKIVGIAVGVPLSPLGPMTVSQNGLSIIVPSSTICRLIAEKVNS